MIGRTRQNKGAPRGPFSMLDRWAMSGASRVQHLARLDRVTGAVEGVEPEVVGAHLAGVPRMKAGLTCPLQPYQSVGERPKGLQVN